MQMPSLWIEGLNLLNCKKTLASYRERFVWASSILEVGFFLNFDWKIRLWIGDIGVP